MEQESRSIPPKVERRTISRVALPYGGIGRSLSIAVKRGRLCVPESQSLSI